jgi:pimeloyl-ACP methyl ester carboxylesterase
MLPKRRASSRSYVSPLFLLAFMALLLSSSAFAQQPPAAKEGKAASTTKREEDVVRRTRDGVQLAMTYYAGVTGGEVEQGMGKKTIPVVLLHGLKQNRNGYKDLALALQKAGYAVIVPDLRGHGGSTRLVGAGRDTTLDVAKMTPGQFGLMVTQDMRTVKDFLWQKNNDKELNIDKLCIVGFEMGTSVAMNFAMFDAVEQERNPVPRSDYKIGCFVKGLVLVSPELAFRGLPTRKAAFYPYVQRDIATMLVVGKQDAKAESEAKRLHSILAKVRSEPEGDENLDQQTLFFNEFDTKLQGMKLLDPKFNLAAVIDKFLQRRLVKADAARNWTWKERKYPYE